jgi:hypothetical protein
VTHVDRFQAALLEMSSGTLYAEIVETKDVIMPVAAVDQVVDTSKDQT